MNIPDAAAHLERRCASGLCWWTDPQLEEEGVLVAFSERTGGVSEPPYASLNLAAHVGDAAAAVDDNRSRLLSALGLASTRDRLTCAEQVHGACIAEVTEETVGAGAWADTGPLSVAGTDALFTSRPGVPLLMCFADCVPVAFVAPGPWVAVVHAGWRGALAGLPGMAAVRMASKAGCEPQMVRAYVGPHIGPRDYKVGDEILSQFVNTFGTFARAESGGLDLGAVVATDLARSGVPSCRIDVLGASTAEQTDRFFSYRAEGGLTGRHGLLACILS